MATQQRSFRQVAPEPTTLVAPAAPSLMAVGDSVLSLSDPVEVDIETYRGDTGRFRITVTNEDTSPADLTGATWDADIRLTAGAASAITSFDVEPVDGDSSSVDVILPEAKANLLGPGTLAYDVEMRLDGEVITLVKGKITVTQDVSRTP